MKTSLAQIFTDLTPDKFLMGDYARDQHDKIADPAGLEAIKWCSIGWIIKKCNQKGFVHDLSGEYSTPAMAYVPYE
ncbi:MAG: hypothetical protein MN733_24910, partial [Nitrososphaera sp.]|nr:hypothetical protein [Nitrososphaera sp.]